MLTVFHNDIEDIIGLSEPNEVGDRVHINGFGAKSQGIELEMKAKVKRGSYLAANYTYQNP
ncbi:MAG: TonB-dependent receptor, partial [Candidatus Poribacteria bacterium]|nr:TonB-dependent receptor [Candidatus Poribacteria bacterium]